MPRHLYESVSTQTGSYEMTLGDNLVLCNGTFTVTLPATSGIGGREYTIKNVSTGTITVDANASETIDGETTQTLSQWDSMTITTDGSNWYIV